MESMKVGILGAGRIAGVMAGTLARMETAKAVAVASRDLGRARELAGKYGIPKAYGSYAEMLNNPEVKLVYIATPHSHHYEHIMTCLDHGKHVLCEKAFTANARQAEDAIALARSKKLLLTEAMWIRYQPFTQSLRRLVESGIVGEASFLSANLCALVKHKPRVYETSLGGGALLDLGVYPLNFAAMIFGTDVASTRSSCIKYPTGVDAQFTITLAYADGKMASLYSSILCGSDKQGIIHGDKGYIVVDNINNPDSAQVFGIDRRLQEVRYRQPVITGYEYEVDAAARAIREGAVECPEMPHAETIRIMHLLDALREEWGVEIPGK